MNMNKYPEHLNPFADESKRKTTLKLSNSFRDFTKTLRKSFRIHKKHDDYDKVEIRHKAENFQRLPISYPNGTETSTPALPRSRFQERLTKSRTFNPISTSTPTSHKNNPFDDDHNYDDDDDKPKIEPPIRRRGKRRAPLPPKSISSQNLNCLDPQHSSHWSLTSADTDLTCSTDNLNEVVYNTDGDRLSITENFVDFNKYMEKLNEQNSDNNNNNFINKDKDNIPDLVVTCSNNDETQQIDEINQNDDEIKNGSDNEEIIVKDITENLQNPESHEVQIETKHEHNDIQNDHSSFTENLNDTKDIPVDNDNCSKIDDIDVNTINTKEISNNNHSLNGNDIEGLSIKDDDTTDQPFLYHENKSLFITGSTDDLISDDKYTGRYSLYIEGSKENLDQCNNNEIAEDNNNNNNEPVAKQRKSKLTKNLLLGTTE